MITVLDASVALKWFVDDEPLVREAQAVLDAIATDPAPYVVPDLFLNEVLAVLARLPGMTRDRLVESLALVEALGLSRVGNGHELVEQAAERAIGWGLSGYDAVYVALAELTGGCWLTADARAAARVKKSGLARVLGR